MEREDQHGVVASTCPGCGVTCAEHSVGFGFGEVGDECLVVAFRGDS